MARVIYNIRKIRQVADETTAKIVFHALLQSNVQYGILIWGNSAHADKAFKMQKKAVRAIASVSQRTPCRPLYKRYEILTLPSLFILECIKSILGRRTDLRTNADIHTHCTKNREKLHTPAVHLTIARSESRYWGFHFYNKLPRHVQEMSPDNLIKTLKKSLIEGAFYTIEEFMAAPGIL